MFASPEERLSDGQVGSEVSLRKLALECARLLVQYHENGYCIVDENTFASAKKILSSHD